MPSPARIYLDNAATSWPKPETVYTAVDRCRRELGAPAGRGVYAEAAEVERAVVAARRGVAELIGATDARQIVFTANGTDALNLAIHGLLRAPCHVITSVAEHNSVLRPLRLLEDAGRITVTRVSCNAAGVVDPQAFEQAFRADTRLVALAHASNVTGALQPAAEIGALARQRGAVYLLDAAQTAGELPLDVDSLHVDLLAAPGHKGLLGPLGTGFLYVRPGIVEQLESVRQGGTGSVSELDRQPEFLPDKYESGNLNVPGIFGLAAGLAHLRQQGISAIRQHAVDLTERLLAGLTEIRGLTVYGPPTAGDRVGIVSFTLDGYDPQEVAILLDSAYRVQTRAGLHCAPRMHVALGTSDRGGTVRLSLGCFNTAGQIDIALAALREIAAGATQ